MNSNIDASANLASREHYGDSAFLIARNQMRFGMEQNVFASLVSGVILLLAFLPRNND
jgi:hypothetical protein